MLLKKGGKVQLFTINSSPTGKKSSQLWDSLDVKSGNNNGRNNGEKITANSVLQSRYVGFIASALFIFHSCSFSFKQMRTSKRPTWLTLPDGRNDVSLPGGGQRGQQVLVLTEHQHVPEAGVGQSGGGSADAEQVVAQNHGSASRYRGSLWEGLVWAGHREGRRLAHQD